MFRTLVFMTALSVSFSAVAEDYSVNLQPVSQDFELMVPSIPSLPSESNITNFHEVEPNFYRSGSLTPENVEELASNFGVKTIISVDAYLMNETGKKNEIKAAKKYGINYINIPMAEIGHLDMNKVLKTFELLKTAERPLIVHCHRGSERTGIVVGMYRLLANHWNLGDTFSEMNALGFNFLFRGWQDDLAKYYKTHDPQD